MSKVYDQLMKSGKFTAAQNKADSGEYVDSISGGDFTYTLIQPSFVNDYYNLLKIKESVATRLVIIDERIFEHYKPMVTMNYLQCASIKEGINNEEIIDAHEQ